jgi:hypothetical protein
MTEPKVTIIDSLHDLLDVVSRLNQRLPTEVWWRGHAMEEWNLLPHIWRLKPGKAPRLKEQLQLERNLTIRFLHGATTRHPHWPEEDHSVQLAMMQHYGLPTRLLDWTESPLFALFFAVREREYETRDGALWALNPAGLNVEEFSTPMLLSPHTDSAKDLFKAPFGVAETVQEKNAAVVVRHVDPRMSVQLSSFTIHGSQVPLEEMRNSHKYLMKYVVPPQKKAALRLQLSELGIREASLFPDLEHLALELKTMTQDGRIRGTIPNELYDVEQKGAPDRQ